MNGWRQTTLGEVCDEVSGIIQTGPFGSQLHQSDYSDVGIPVVMPKDIVEGKIASDTIARVSTEHVSRLSRHKLSSGDIVYGRRGDIGRQALIGPEQAGWICGTGCLRLSLGDSVVDPLFLHYYLRQDDVVSWITNQAVGATMPNLNTGILRSVPVRFPSLPIQRRIAGILSTYDELIDNSQRRIKILETMARKLYREWFVHFCFPGHESVPCVPSPIGSIPQGWQAKALAELADLSLGKMLDQKKNRGQPLPYLANVNVRWGEFDLSELREMRFEVNELETYGLRRGDIVMCEGGEPGRCAIWMEKAVGMMIQKALHRIRCRDDMHRVYLYHTLRHLAATGALAALFTGATIKHLPQEKLAKVHVLQPPGKLVAMFANNAEPIESLIHSLQSRVRTLRRARDLLLPRLLSGQIDVEAIAS